MTTATDLSRATLLFLSRREGLKDVAVRLRPLRALSRRFIAGESLEEALEAVRELNAQGLMASFDHLNEAVRNPDEALDEVHEYQRLLARIDQVGVRGNVSLKLTQCGLLFDRELALRNAREVVADAKRRGSFVRVDMERRQIDLGLEEVLEKVRRDERKRGPMRSSARPKKEQRKGTPEDRRKRKKQRLGKKERAARRR